MEYWHELIVEGTEKTLRAFVVGFRAGLGTTVPGVFGSDIEIEPESVGERLRALFTAGSHHAYFAPRSLAMSLAGAVAAEGATIGLRLEGESALDSAAFAFRIEVYSRELAREVRGVLVDALPAGVSVDNLSQHEETHPEAIGPEPFAPLHAYIYRVSGRIDGAFEGVLRLWQRAREWEFADIGSLSLIRKPIG